MNIIEREFVALRSQRVRMRKAIEHYQMRATLERQNLYGPDGHLNAIANLEMQLRGTQRRWEELHLLLGRRVPGPPVKLDVPVRRYGATTKAPGPYVTKVIRP